LTKYNSEQFKLTFHWTE